MKYTISALILVLFNCIACNQKLVKKSYDLQQNEISTFQQKIDSTKLKVKTYFEELIDGNFYQLCKYNICSNYDIKKLQLYGSIIFNLDSINFSKISDTSSIENLIEIDKSNLLYYAALNDTIRVCIYPKIVSNKLLNGAGYSNVFSGLSKKVFSLFKQNINVYNLYLFPFERSSQKTKGYVFYKNKNNEYMAIQSNGSEVSLKNSLLSYKTSFFKNK